MNSTDLAASIADPVQLVGMSYYFAPSTAEMAPNYGLNVFEFYGLGRGGVLGDVSSDYVFETFAFFHRNAVEFLWSAARSKASPDETAQGHIEAAYAYADLTFGAIAPEVLRAFADAGFKAVDAVESGPYPLVDGYKKFARPESPVHAAMLAAILLRELRGGVHIDAVNEVGLAYADACYLADAGLFKLHGYTPEDVPEVTPELEALKAKAEVITGQLIEKYFDVLSDDERQALHEGAMQMNAAVANPVAVQ